MKQVKKFLSAFLTAIENCCTSTPVTTILYHIVNDAKHNTASFFIFPGKVKIQKLKAKSDNGLFVSHIFRFPVAVLSNAHIKTYNLPLRTNNLPYHTPYSIHTLMLEK